jgi:hypothetical protein
LGDYLIFLDDDKYFIENGVNLIKSNLVKDKINIFQIYIGENIISGDIELGKIDTSSMLLPLKFLNLFPFWKLFYGGDFYFIKTLQLLVGNIHIHHHVIVIPV